MSGNITPMVLVTRSMKDITDEIFHETSQKIRAALIDSATTLQDKWRAQVLSAGLGQKLANSVRIKKYPRDNVDTLRPAALVFSNADKLMNAYNTGGVIRPKNGSRYLAIPTENVPRDFSTRRPMTPDDVETHFNQDLFFRPYKDGRAGGVLYLKNVTKSKNGKTWREATKGRRRQGRKIEEPIMFILIPQATLKKRLDIDRIKADADADFYAKLIASLNHDAI